MTRRDAREQAFALIFQMNYTDEPVKDLAEAAFLCRDEEMDPYALKVAEAFQEHFLEVDATINRYSTKWKLSRLSKVTATILRLAVCELDYIDDVPVGAVINEAVELAKKYGGDEDPAYVNGVLGGYARAKESGGKASEEAAASVSEEE